MDFYICLMSVAIRALGDKSELPLLASTSSLTLSSDNSDTETQNNAFESQLGDLAITAVAGTDGNGEVNIGPHDMVDAGLENVTSDMNHSEPVLDTDAAVELDAEDAAVAASDSNCEAAAEMMTTHGDDAGSYAKGEIKSLDIQVVTHIFCVLTSTTLSFLSFVDFFIF